MDKNYPLIEKTMYTLGVLIDEDILKNYVEKTLHYCEEDAENYVLNIMLSDEEEDAINCELRICNEEGKQKAYMQVFDANTTFECTTEFFVTHNDFLNNLTFISQPISVQDSMFIN